MRLMFPVKHVATLRKCVRPFPAPLHLITLFRPFLWHHGCMMICWHRRSSVARWFVRLT